MSSSVNDQLAPPPPPKPRISPLEYRNTDLVSRLLAATPPYLYNMSLLPNTYFFSEMLRSFVQAKADPSRSLQHRRTRKRTWSATKAESLLPKLENDWNVKHQFPEKCTDTPLELTTEEKNKFAPESKPINEQTVESLYPINQENPGLILPPPPPMWYPPLYPTTTPYGIDPLHFFIDLRVSGHIYDRKNREETNTGKTETEEAKVKEPGFKQSRHASAFSVPTPRLRSVPMNLSQNEDHQETKKFDVKSMGFEKVTNKTGTSYIMGNIGTIYKSVTEEQKSEHENESEEERQKRVKDLRALIGLELVVDYMNHAKPQPKRPEEFIDSEAGSPTLEVVAIQDELVDNLKLR